MLFSSGSDPIRLSKDPQGDGGKMRFQKFLVVTIGVEGGIGIGIGIDSHLYISDLSSCLKKRILDGITRSTG